MTMASWLSVYMQYYPLATVVRRFIARLEGRLKEWYLSLGEYRQIQIQNSTSVEVLLQFVYAEFFGKPDHDQDSA